MVDPGRPQVHVPTPNDGAAGGVDPAGVPPGRRRTWRTLPLLLALAAPPVLAQLPDSIPPEPPPDADLPALALWIEHWLPVVGAASYSALDSTADFYAYTSDSVTAARLDGCTLVLHERLAGSGSAGRWERRVVVHVPLDQIDTTLVEPKIRRSQLLLTRPNVLLGGRLVVPLRNRARTGFITVFSDDDPGRPSLATEHLVPFPFALPPAARSAAALRRAAARCAAAP